MAGSEKTTAPSDEGVPPPSSLSSLSAGPPLRRTAPQRATLVATGVAALLLLAIVLGSRGLRDFDSALLPYTVASVLVAFGLAYRVTVRAPDPAAGRLRRQERRAAFSWRDPRRTTGARRGLRTFLRARPRAGWVAYQLVFWGCLLAAVITFPLVWGWLTLTTTGATGPGYELRLGGVRMLGFDSASLLGWSMDHGLDLAAVLVTAGTAYLLRWRTRDRAAITGQDLGHDLLPLIALLTVSVTGLLLTFSELALRGGGYQFLALLHMASVVFTLAYLPLGKFFHAARRPAAGAGLPDAAPSLENPRDTPGNGAPA